ncbi:DUF2461 domain-containing protein [Dyadobacter psychrotolerans]|uniref:DUF2461 domain-containing protein n=1 Tax=Dyadobacter psychrotolerans TaxID=2541721 RepID=A0A4R5DQX4_9BACT|nr:DUF2461 domain-containing protein [Dyadobacter psychrotolerans]TDE14674.1 DUF2461 domain-containing protein [Dyadobacter psychrotolerans]
MSHQSISIPASSLDFLELLKENNNRDWFNANKEDFLQQQTYIENFAGTLLNELSKHDLIETQSGKKSLHRIYRDTRFSKEKIPYKTNWSGSFSRATKQLRGGYYFHIQPGNSFVAGGFMEPNAEDLKRVRDDISFDAGPLRKILKSKSFVETFGKLRGEQVKTAPKGFASSHEAIELLRFKQFLLIKNFTDNEVLSPLFLENANHAFKNMRPFFNYMSEVLTVDSDGIGF